MANHNLWLEAEELLDRAKATYAAAQNYWAWAKFGWHFVWAAGILNIAMAIWNLWSRMECTL